MAESAPARRGFAVAAGAWGFAEATLFFIVPDVLLTWIALRGVRPGLIACAWALAGALAGGALMWLWGAGDMEQATAMIERLPAIDAGMIEQVGRDIRKGGMATIFLGPLTGVPYKIYAAWAGALNVNLALFLLISVPARAIRFIVMTLIAAGISAAVGDRLTLRSKTAIHLSLWVAFYIWYFAVMPN